MVTRSATIFWLTLALGVYAFLCYGFIDFMEIDACLDAGGMFDYSAYRCVGAAHEVPPLTQAGFTPFPRTVSGLRKPRAFFRSSSSCFHAPAGAV